MVRLGSEFLLSHLFQVPGLGTELLRSNCHKRSVQLSVFRTKTVQQSCYNCMVPDGLWWDYQLRKNSHVESLVTQLQHYNILCCVLGMSLQWMGAMYLYVICYTSIKWKKTLLFFITLYYWLGECAVTTSLMLAQAFKNRTLPLTALEVLFVCCLNIVTFFDSCHNTIIWKL